LYYRKRYEHLQKSTFLFLLFYTGVLKTLFSMIVENAIVNMKPIDFMIRMEILYVKNALNVIAAKVPATYVMVIQHIIMKIKKNVTILQLVNLQNIVLLRIVKDLVIHPITKRKLYVVFVKIVSVSV